MFNKWFFRKRKKFSVVAFPYFHCKYSHQGLISSLLTQCHWTWRWEEVHKPPSWIRARQHQLMAGCRYLTVFSIYKLPGLSGPWEIQLLLTYFLRKSFISSRCSKILVLQSTFIRILFYFLDISDVLHSHPFHSNVEYLNFGSLLLPGSLEFQ